MNKEVMLSHFKEMNLVLKNMHRESRELELKGYLHVPTLDIESAMLEIEKDLLILENSTSALDEGILAHTLEHARKVLTGFEKKSFKWSNVWFLKRKSVLNPASAENNWQVVS